MNKVMNLYGKIESKYKDHYYFVYTVVFVVTILFVFSCFLVTGKSFVWIIDGWMQHLKASIYYTKWLRSIIKEILFVHALNIPTYSFSIGYGGDILTILHYYVIGDPLTLLAVLIPTKYMAIFYSAIIIIRFYLSGITFSMFCLYMEKKVESSSRFGKTAIIAGTLVYIFSGFALYGGLRHPFFINPMIYFPLVILGVEKILDGKKPTLFILAVFISAISNFYFFYMIAILTILYVLWRFFSIYSSGQILEGLRKIRRISLSAVLGTGMSAVILLPEILAFLNSSRWESRYVYDFLYSLHEYESHIGGFLSITDVHKWTEMGYAAIALIAVILLFLKKDHKDVRIAFIVLTLMTLLPVAGSMMNGFSYVTNRWIWGYSFLIAYIVVLKWNSLFVLTLKERAILLVSLCAYFLVCVILKRSGNASVLFGCSMAFITLGAVYLAKEMYGIKYAQIIAIVCIIINVAGNAFFKYSPARAGYVKEFLTYKEMRDKFKNTETDVIDAVAKKDKRFFRYSGTSITPNGTLLSGLHSTQYYWSIENGNITKFRSEMGLSDQLGHTFMYNDFDSRTILSTLANVKYYVQPGNVPYGFKMVDLKNNNSRYKLWDNAYFLPFGYTYTGYIPEERYKKMPPVGKQEALLQGCVVDNGQGPEAKVYFTGKQINYEINLGKDIFMENNIITVKKNNSLLTLTFDGLTEAETYLYLTNFNFIGNPAADEQQVWMSAYKDNKSLFYRKYYKGPDDLKLFLSAQNTTEESIRKTLGYQTPRFQWYNNREDFLVNFGYGKDAKKSITIQFPIAGKYLFDSLQVLCQPIINYSEQLKKLAEDVLQNVDFHDKNAAFATNKVTGDITLNTAKYLLLTIPYSNGWTAVVDGKGQDLMKANTMWMALYLEPGHHDILLKYQTPGLKVGAVISGISFLLLLIFLYIGKRKSQRGDYLC